jgi:exodeoxyribonuclease-5
MAYQLSQQQGGAVKKIVRWFLNDTAIRLVFKLAGFAGTGKSTIRPDILDGLGLNPADVAFCAPTGKAAKVMGEKLRAQGIKVYPSTIHSLIYQPKMQKADVLERELEAAQKLHHDIDQGVIPPPSGDKRADLKEASQKIAILTKDLDRAYDTNDLRFSLNPDSKLISEQKKLIIVDEASMVGKEMAEDLASFDIPILAIGDPGQLPPVGDEPGFLDGDYDAFLTEVHRQAAENPIIHLATLVRKGERGEYGDYGSGVLVIRPREDVYSLDISTDRQLIVGTNKKRWQMTSKLRKASGFLTTGPSEGEPLIMCKNSKQHPALVNGMQVYSRRDHEELTPGESRFLIDIADEDGNPFRMFAYQGLFEEHIKREKNYSTAAKSSAYRARITDNHIDFGWAITCHKSQGSQWDEVIVHDESFVFKEAADQWLYTAITRAAERLIIVAPE